MNALILNVNGVNRQFEELSRNETTQRVVETTDGASGSDLFDLEISHTLRTKGMGSNRHLVKVVGFGSNPAIPGDHMGLKGTVHVVFDGHRTLDAAVLRQAWDILVALMDDDVAFRRVIKGLPPVA